MKFNEDIFNLALGNDVSWNTILVVCLCSSGVDSIAATHYMNKKFGKVLSWRDIKFHFTTLHIDHNYREQNLQMLISYEDFCRIESVPKSISQITHHASRKKFTEDYLRKARHDILGTFFEHFSKTKIIFVTGHHLDDCVENYMLNVIRGHPAYAPMPTISKHQGDCYEYIMCKPFIFSRKQEMINYCADNDLLRYVCEDSTNSESKGSRRNMIRNEILPILERDKVGLPTIVRKMMEKRLSLDIIREC